VAQPFYFGLWFVTLVVNIVVGVQGGYISLALRDEKLLPIAQRGMCVSSCIAVR